MENFYWLEQIKPIDRTYVGDKAFELSKLGQRGYLVPPSFVVSSNVLAKFLQTLNVTDSLIADLPDSCLYVNVDNPQQLQQVAQRLCQEIITAPLPLEWLETLLEATRQYESLGLIFRPSWAVNSVANGVPITGLLEAQVCSCEPEAISQALKQTWSQMFRAKSLLYWHRHKIKISQINLAVLVQPLVGAIASGTLSYHAYKLEIQASLGLGKAITQGEVLPDSYFISLENNTLASAKPYQINFQQLGKKPLAYYLINSPIPEELTPLLTTNNFWQIYLLTEAQQQQYTLKDEHLEQLITLAQKLRQETSAFTLEWTLAQSQASETTQLYITQFNPSVPFLSSPQVTLREQSKTLRGLAASGGRIRAKAYVIATTSQTVEIPPGVILVIKAIAPDLLPLVQQAVGIVTEQGGLTSHSAILARELGIPAVVSVPNVTRLIQTDESILVDGDRGEIYRLSRGTQMETKEEEIFYSHHQPRQLPPVAFVSDHVPIATQLFLNLSQPSLLEQVKNLPIDGVGLLRSELMALNILPGQHPNTWLTQGRETELLYLWQEQILKFTRALAPRPVFYRSLDWRSHEFPSLTSQDSAATIEVNPMLGQRGTFSYLHNPQLFDLELAALAAVQQSGGTNINLLLPFVRTVEEFSFCRRRVEQAGLTQIAQFQLWIMAEVPSVLFLLPEYVKAGVQGISIGTNDLTQLLLGVDRDSHQFATAFDERHPAVMSAIAQIIHMAKSANIPCSICGQAPALYPEIIDSLVSWGITSISVDLEAVERTYNAIARAEQKLLLAAARSRQ